MNYLLAFAHDLLAALARRQANAVRAQYAARAALSPSCGNESMGEM